MMIKSESKVHFDEAALWHDDMVRAKNHGGQWQGRSYQDCKDNYEKEMTLARTAKAEEWCLERLSPKACHGAFINQKALVGSGKKLKITQFDINFLTTHYGHEGVRESPEYQVIQDFIIDTTMSCSPDEAIHWLRFYQADAFERAIGKENNLLRGQFLAAYDLEKEIRG
jgi:hypothetical protein